ncbi:MAG: hypothetical protein P0120_05460 [Nitrospira sp.]|nr:hypothetical protein [Nitrospira sp.]
MRKLTVSLIGLLLIAGFGESMAQTPAAGLSSKGDLPGLITVEGTIFVIRVYRGIGDKGIQLDTPGAVMSTAGARYNLTFSQPSQLQEIALGALYSVKGVVGDALPPNEYDTHPGSWFKVQELSLKKAYTSNDHRLLQAAKKNDYALMKELIENGADVNVTEPTTK